MGSSPSEEEFWMNVEEFDRKKIECVAEVDMWAISDYFDETNCCDHPLYYQMQDCLRKVEETVGKDLHSTWPWSTPSPAPAPAPAPPPPPPSSILLLESDLCIGEGNKDWRTKLQYLIWKLPRDMEIMSNSLGELECLQHLTIKGNNKVKCLPDSITRLYKLQQLELDYCPNVQHFPSNLDQLVSLTDLTIKGCKIRALPQGIIRLSNLQVLDMEECLSLQVLPHNLHELVSLKKLRLKNCGINDLPATILKLHNLKVLDLRGCSNLKQLPLKMNYLVNLEKLHIRGTNIKLLPSSIKRLGKLRVLDLPDSFGFRKLIDNLDKLFSKIPLELFVCDGAATLTHSGQETSDILHIVGDESQSLVNDAWNVMDENNEQPVRDEDEEAHIGPSENEDGNNAEGISVENVTSNILGTSNDQSNITIDSGDLHHGLDNREMSVCVASSSKHENVDKQVTSEFLYSCLAQGMKLEDAADKYGVSKSTFKRMCRKNGIQDWSKSKKRHKRDTESTTSGCTSSQSQLSFHCPTIHPADNEQVVLGTLDAPNSLSIQTMTVNNATTRKSTRKTYEISQHDAEPSSSDSFLVKASYKDDILRFYLAPSSTIAKLKEQVQERLPVEDGKFKIQYQDDELEWVIMACSGDLQECLRLSALSGKDRLRLKILDTPYSSL